MKRLAICLALALLAACAKPLPPEHRDLVGQWQGPDMQLTIEAGGRVAYARRSGGHSRSIDAPIQDVRADGFTAGLGPMTTTFRIDRRPHLENGAWTMTVDGVVLRRVDAAPVVVPDVER